MSWMSSKQHRSRGSILLVWLAAILLAAGVMFYQRLTGPTHPLRGEASIGDDTVSYRLLRSDESSPANDATSVRIAASNPQLRAVLQYKRYGTDDAFTALPMQRGQPGAADPDRASAGDREAKLATQLMAQLPAQPAAGKLEYFIELRASAQAGAAGTPTLRIPRAEAGNVVIRYKDAVPAVYLILHIVLVVLTLIFGVRTILAALFDGRILRRWVWITMICMTGGVAIFGPIVQKYAFGKYWSGWPYGGDWTDNKSAVMWGAWLLACLVIGLRGQGHMQLRRGIVLLGALAMFAAFVIPHSYRGSTLDYGLVDQGVPASEAVREGR
jgi:hypothetical protein